ncbi:AAA-like domain-containing protein [Laspinema sp. A4]|uniref:AAA-like domain-containing protein n=1 Tax=Laspinema sp. D2d TaxID=2953686 RepID=UPI0021BAD974|nr:AAA-like domain-containing protein [Laspinema sp. D2d]MCT7986342.1 AAA-like domain-containing protein [Laspinema sp. D2d]
MAGRSLRVHPDYIKKVKYSLQRNGFPTQKHLAEDMGLCRDTISRFLNGKAVDNENFEEICHKLDLDLQEIANLETGSDPDDAVADLAYLTLDETGSNLSNYVERPPIEERCYQTVLQPGSLIRIKAPKQMGKSALMTQILSRVKTNGYQSVALNLLAADGKVLQDLDYFLKWFCRVVSRQLKLPSDSLEDLWEEDLGSNYKCTLYFEECLLENFASPVVLALDEVDRLFHYPHIAEDFFSLLRLWHEEATKTEIWKKLRLILAYSTEVYIPLNIHKSPFNVGEPILLPEFTPPQLQEFARQQGVKLESDEIEKLMNLIGGHPSLLQITVSRLKRQEITFENLLETAATESGIYRDRLRTHLGYLQQNPLLSQAMKEAVRTPNPIRLESKLAYQLESLGLVRLEGNDCRIACDLYRKYFRDRL